MKKIALLFTLSFAFLACEKETESINTNQELSFETASIDSELGIYKGVFTTLDSETRATVEITITDATTFADISGNRAKAVFTFEDGQTLYATANRSIEIGEAIEELEFNSPNLTFSFSVNNDGSNPTISNVVYKNKNSAVSVIKHSNKAPVTTINGTYACDVCNDHPVLDNSGEQTFNLMLVNDTDSSQQTLTVQSVTGGITYMGTGTQQAGTDNNNGTFSAPFDGTITAVSDTFSTFAGIHTYGGFDMGDPVCSDFDGTWSWVTNNFGTISGTFASTVTACNPVQQVIAVEDFDGGVPNWMSTPSIPYFNAAGGSDFFGVSDGSTGGSSSNIDYIDIAGNFLYIQDLENDNGGTNAFADVVFDNVDVSAATGITVSFDYDVVGFDGGDDVNYTVIIDGVDQTEVTLINGVNGGGTTAEGNESISIPDGTSTVGLKLSVKQNGGSDYAGFDNFKVEGIQ